MSDSDTSTGTSSSSSSQGGAMNTGALRRMVSQRLAESIIRPVANSGGGSGGPAAPAQRQDSHNHLLRTNTNTELNRQQFSRTQNAMARAILKRGFNTRLFFQLVVAMLVLRSYVLGYILYVIGWFFWTNNHTLPCDQPLASWLIGWLFFIPLTNLLPVMVECTQLDDGRRFATALLFKVGIMIARGGLIALGFWLYWRSKTCATTNDQLYHFVRMYVVFNIVLWVVKVLVECVATPFVLFMAQRHAALFGGPGEHRAARQGLIDNIETIAYASTLFSDTDPDKESPECCICQGDFEEGGMRIKRVPCCSHHFHEQCLGNWLGSYGKTCPLCRMDLQKVIDGRSAAATV